MIDLTLTLTLTYHVSVCTVLILFPHLSLHFRPDYNIFFVILGCMLQLTAAEITVLILLSSRNNFLKSCKCFSPFRSRFSQSYFYLSDDFEIETSPYRHPRTTTLQFAMMIKSGPIRVTCPCTYARTEIFLFYR